MPHYYSVSSTGEVWVERPGRRECRRDWHILTGPHASREEAEETGVKHIFEAHPPERIMAKTLYKNLLIVPKSKLRRYYIKLED